MTGNLAVLVSVDEKNEGLKFAIHFYKMILLNYVKIEGGVL